MRLLPPLTGMCLVTATLGGLACDRTAQVFPREATLGPGGTLQLRAASHAAPPGSAWKWSLVSPALGDLDASGQYRAPRRPGTCEVEACNTALPRLRARARIHVKPLDVLRPEWTDLADWHRITEAHPLPGGRILCLQVAPFHRTLVFDPATRSFTPVPNPSRTGLGATFTTLPDGRILAVGGASAPDRDPPLMQAFDPGKGTWSTLGPLLRPRQGHTATVLQDGRVLFAGGFDFHDPETRGTAEIFDPSDGSRYQVGNLSSPRCGHCAILLPDGRVLLAGGRTAPMWGGYSYAGLPLATVEVFDPVQGRFSPLDAPLEGSRETVHSGVALPDGRVLLAWTSPLDPGSGGCMELLDPGHGTSSLQAGPFPVQKVVGLLDGSALLIGKERMAILDPATFLIREVDGRAQRAPSLSHALLTDGRVLFVRLGECLVLQ